MSDGTYTLPTTIALQLPFPPSVNHYWRRTGSKFYVSKAGVAFRKNVEAVFVSSWRRGRPKLVTCLLSVSVWLTPPDDRYERDVDNYGGKALLDAMQHCGIYQNDRQVKRLTIEMLDKAGAGKCLVLLTNYIRDPEPLTEPAT